MTSHPCRGILLTEFDTRPLHKWEVIVAEVKQLPKRQRFRKALLFISAPFVIIGRRLRSIFRWPALRLQAEPDRWSDFLTCTRNCPTSLDVNQIGNLSNQVKGVLDEKWNAK